MFSLKVLVLRLTDTQPAASFSQAVRLASHPGSSFPLASSQPINQQLSTHSLTFFRESFIYSCKQRGGAAVLGEGRDTITQETCDAISLNINNLRKSAVLHFAFLCGWDHAKLSLTII
jgi:hypothetical protein